MAETAILWLRRDLRIHDNPALHAALGSAGSVLPVFVLDRRVFGGRWGSGDRTRFMLESLTELRQAFEHRGGILAVRSGDPVEVLPALAEELSAAEVHATSDAAPFALERDARVAAALTGVGAELIRHPGAYCADISRIRTKQGKPYTVFTPFSRNWAEAPRRRVLQPPDEVASPQLDAGEIPTVDALGLEASLSDPLPGGEEAARSRMEEWLADGVHRYKELHDDLASHTSLLSPHLHIGTLSARELEERVEQTPGDQPAAFRRQLAWRDFYAHVILNWPANTRQPLQERFRDLEWVEDGQAWSAWCDGRTGYPLVDAAMRELSTTGFMHNRARMVVASFLTKDLHIDYRAGEAWFMKLLLDGDTAQNNGNWQWTASLGVDPQPYFKRIFNPILQQRKYDPEGVYVRRWVPELRDVPLERLFEPWTMSEAEQKEAGCTLGSDYPHPIVEHKRERERAIERYRATAESPD